MALTLTHNASAITFRPPILADEPNLSVSYSPEVIVLTGSTSTTVTNDDAVFDVYNGGTFYNGGSVLVTGTQATFESLNTDIATIASDGVITRVASGQCRVLVKNGVTIGIDLNLADQTQGDTESYANAVVGSLAEHVSNEIDSRIDDTMSMATNGGIYSTQNHVTSTYVRNTNLWCDDVDLTCASPWNSRGGSKRAGTLITAQHLLMASHYPLYIGDTVRFVANDNTILTRTITGVVNHPDYSPYYPDLRVAVLDSALPSSITPCKLMPSDYEDYLVENSSNRPGAIGLDQEEKALIIDWTGGGNFTTPTDSDRLIFHENIISGDSGNPAGVIVDGEFVSVTMWTYGGAGSGTPVADFISDINTMITTADTQASVSTGLTVVEADFSAFPNYGTDTDAVAYIADVRTAGATVSATQETALNTFYKVAKAGGYYTSLKRIYLPIWAVEAANAIDMISLTSGTFNGGVTHSAGYVEGNGSTGYFDLGIDPATMGVTTDSVILGGLLRTEIGASQNIIASREGSNQCRFNTSSNNNLYSINGNTTINDGNSGLTGILVASFLSGDVFISKRDSSSTSSLASQSYTAGGATPTVNFYAMAVNVNGSSVGHTDDQFGAWFAGTGMTLANSDDFTLALKNLWETCTGLTLPGSSMDSDAAAYIADVRTAGATVSATQETALDTFYKVAKADGYYTSLKRMYLPIWAVEAANAIDMVTLATGTFNGGVTHSAGYVEGNGSTGYFALGVKPTPLGVLPDDAFQFSLNKTNLDGGATAIGCRDASGDDWRLASENSSTLVWATCMSSSTGTLTAADSDFTGILTHNRKGTDYSLNRRKTAGRAVLDSASRSDAGTTPDENIVALAGSNNGSVFDYTTSHFGSYGVGLGMTDTQDQDFTLALKNLWETCTGLTLP